MTRKIVAHRDGVGLEVLLALAWRNRPLDGHDHLGPLLQELLLRLLDDNRVRVAHHGDQHVEQQDGNEDLEKDKDGLCHRLIRTLAEILVLKRQIVIKDVPKCWTVTSYSPSVMWKRATQVVWYVEYRPSSSTDFMMK